MKKHYLAILVTMFLSITGTMLGNTELPAPSSHIVNLIPTKYQSSEHLRKGGRSATINVVPGKSYLISVSAKLAHSSTNPETALRLKKKKKGKKGVRAFEWYKLTSENFTKLSLLYKAPVNVTQITIVLKPRFTSDETAVFKDFTAVEVSEDIDK